ncbi:UDP-N-acetylmuramate--L-alanine ligase [Eggerthellaceae bacterium 3-80]|nr:UDP-N-acetylmuramate--L-alanine ligase [bacterium D16-34]
MDKPLKQIHFIGVGGVGMSGIARVAHDQGMKVSGSDLRDSRYTQQLRDAGIEVFIGHDASHVPQGDPVVVVSTAILDNNPELIAAKERGLTIWHRAQMLAHLGQNLETLAVAGTHGKTTTSSMLATVLDTMGQDPTFLIGGIVRAYGTNAHSGTGKYYVVEADESDKSFMHIHPQVVLVTNIEADHLDHYKDLDEIYEKFASFVGSVPKEGGLVVACADDAALVSVVQNANRQYFTYGFTDNANAKILSYEAQGVGSAFSLELPDGQVVNARVPQNPGKHNVQNAAGVITLLWALGYDPQKAAAAMSEFAGVKRRFDLVGIENEITIVDDYAHHPTEIAATIEAASQLGYNHVHVLFQPHRYSRAPLFTEVLHDEFGQAFNRADAITFMDVYPAGEAPVPGVSGKTFLNVVLDNPQHPAADYVPRRIEVVPHLIEKLEPGDLIITMGAGDVTAIGPELLDALRKRSASKKQD